MTYGNKRPLFPASRKKARLQGRRWRPSLEHLEARELLTVSTFQHGVAGYAEQQDTVLYSRAPDVNAGTEGSISPDQQDANGVRQGLVRFDGIIGAGRIPLGARIQSAELVLDVVNPSNSAMQMSFYRMLADWSESSATWNGFGAIGGVQASEGESTSLPPDAVLLDPNTTAASPTAGRMDVTKSLEYWAAGADNFGWLIESAATDGWDFRTKESAVSQRPKLIVDWVVPSTIEYQILNQHLTQAEGDGGIQTAIIDVARTGDLANPSSISYSIAAGTAQGNDFEAVPNGTLNFAAGQALATIEVTIHGDTALEGLETVVVTLTSGNTVPGRGQATVVIGDDDALINEVLANVTNNQDETNREYIELIGTPGAVLDDYYFVVFEGEEEEGAIGDNGAGAGVADFVFDLSGHAFGTNGLLVIAPTNWEYLTLADPATTIVAAAALDGAGGVLEDSSQTYALVRSPNAPMVQGVDYDIIGTYENPTNAAIGVGVGILDQLPSGADLIDSVGVVEGGGGDRDRVATPEFPGHPGIHVHQPTPYNSIGSNVTSDAVSRRFGQSLPNSIGAWFNGDIGNGDPSNGPIRYANDTFFISVVAPDGSVLTPGAHNLLRTVFFNVDDQGKEVAEADGSVTLTIERTGDLNEELIVSYETVDIGSATADMDYAHTASSVTFGVGQASREITIAILSDQIAEGFERFRIEITSVTDLQGNPTNYLITDGLPNDPGPSGLGVPNGEATVTIVDADVSQATFQNGVNGYNGTTDAYLDGEFVLQKFGQDPVIRVDQVKGEGEPTAVVRPQQGLLRFDDLFGAAVDQVPYGSKIFDAFLTLNVQNAASGADIRFFRMLQEWEQVNASWLDPQGSAGASIVNGVTPDDVESTAIPDTRVVEPGRAGFVQIPLNVDTIQSWANQSLDNFGWSIVSNSGSLWAFHSSEAFLPGTFKPELTILYTEPVPAETGAFSFSADSYEGSEQGGTARITVNRIGGANGTANVQWQLTAGTGSVTDDVTSPTSGTLAFADGELSKTFTVHINDDSELEINETLSLTLSGSGLTFERDAATLTIRDNDFDFSSAAILLNEMLINSPGNDPPHEYVELVGVPETPMGSLYFVAIEGLIGDREGAMEKVVDLSSYRNGVAASDGSGYTILTPHADDFAFRVPDGVTHIDHLGSLATENLASQNDSTSYMILYSPVHPLSLTEFDYDWDNDGGLELPASVQIVDSVGVRVLGADDQLYGPSTNQIAFDLSDPDVDAISRFRANRERNRGDAWYGGDLFPAGDDYLLYEAAQAFFLPVTGTAMTPGEPNTGTNAESPLVKLSNVVLNANGSVSATFTSPVSQQRIGDGSATTPGGAGITITDVNGAIIPTVDIHPTVSGLGTSTLTMTFTGSGVSNGRLPAGSYRLNFVGNGIIANGRATDVANDGSPIDGFHSQVIVVKASATGDFNGDGMFDCTDINGLTSEIVAGTNNPVFDLSSDGLVNLADLDAWLVLAGAANLPSGAAYLLGDANLDGHVNGQDFVIWNTNKFTSQSAWCSGDFNADGSVNGQDFVIWNFNKFQSSEQGATSVPLGLVPAELHVPARPVNSRLNSTDADDGGVAECAPPLPLVNHAPVAQVPSPSRTALSRELSAGTKEEAIDAIFARFATGPDTQASDVIDYQREI